MMHLMHVTHSPLASPAELLDVLALFPKCTTCGQPLSSGEPIEADAGHAFRLKHVGTCPCTPRAA